MTVMQLLARWCKLEWTPELMQIRKPVDVRKYIVPLAISMFFMMIYLASDSVAYKLVAIGPKIFLPGPPFIFPLSYAIADVVAEVYGSGLSKALIWLALGFELLYALIIHVIINLPSPSFWHLELAYVDVFEHLIRFVISGIFAVLVSSFVNIYLLVRIKLATQGRHFWLRSIVSSAVGGLLLVSIIVLIGYLPIEGSRKSVIMFLSIYSLEFIYAIFLILPSWFLSAILKKWEKADVFDYNVKFNPFKF